MLDGMNYEEKRVLARLGDMGAAACAIRLRAARAVVGLRQNDMAAAIGVKKTTYNNAEAGLTFPSREVMRHFYLEHRIDFNFLMNGDFAQLPGDVQDRLFAALAIANSEWDKREGSNQSPKARLLSQPQT